MIKAYIASPLRLEKFNSLIESEISKIPGITVFLPISLHDLYGYQLEDEFIAQYCYNEIDASMIIIISESLRAKCSCRNWLCYSPEAKWYSEADHIYTFRFKRNKTGIDD